jgi:hypothetical protein
MSTGGFIKSVNTDEMFITLDDNSKWLVYEGYRERIAGWLPDEMISIKHSKDDEYPYMLINVHKNESVEVKTLN